MGLTRPRAAQIFDLDYKQATRVITVANVTLVGGAPAVVDGVSLVLGDRVLVTGQTTASQNGLYDVTVVGVGSDGTWARTSDGNATGEILAGMIVMVTEGALYADTQWKLTTDNPIIIGTTGLTFVINILSSVGGANTQVQVNDGGTLAGFSNFVFDKTSNILSVTGNISATGNITGNYFLGNGSQLSGIITTVDANTLIGNTLSSNVVNSSLTSVGTLGSLSVTGNATAGNLLASGLISATGNITGNYFIGNGSALTGIVSGGTTTYGNTVPASPAIGDVWIQANTAIQYVYFNDNTSNQWAEMAAYQSFSSGETTSPSGANTQIQFNDGGSFGASANLTFDNSSNTLSTSTISATGNITGGNVATGGTVSATGNIITGNLLTAGVVSATGTITGGNLSVTGNVIGNLLPAANVTYDLGSATAQWRTLYVSGNTINMGGATIQTDADSGSFAFVPPATASTPNPTGVVFGPTGDISTVTTTAGTITANLQQAGATTSTVLKITSITYPGDDTAADTAGGQTLTLVGSGFLNGAQVLIGTTPMSTASVVTVVSPVSITFTSPAGTAGNYPVYLVNADGATAILLPGIAYSGTPSWTTASGNIAQVYEVSAVSTTVLATGDAPISYSVNSGLLPTGATLNSSTGLISGTTVATASSTTYNFTVRATDAQQQDTDRAFSITVNPDVVTWSSPANNATTTTTVNVAMSNVAMSAASAAGFGITYTANTLPTGLSITGANIAGTPTLIANTSSLLTATASTSGRSSTRVVNWVVQSVPGPTVIGEAFGGGFYAGQISTTGNGVATHYLIVGPVASAQTQLAWKNENTAAPGANSVIDGPQNTADMVAAGDLTAYPAAHFCNNLSTGGQTDWYMPAKNEFEICYFNLKPTTTTNNTTSGINPNAVPARASNYTSGNPAQTSAAAFQTGGAEAFTTAGPLGYWSSTQRGSPDANFQYLTTGYQSWASKSFASMRLRAVRRVAV